MRAAAAADTDIDRMQAWAGQSARLAEARPAGEIVTGMWGGAQTILQGGATAETGDTGAKL